MIESGSSIGTFQTCPKLYDFRYNQRLESNGYSSSLGFGSFCHAHAERHHGGDPHAPERELNAVLEKLQRLTTAEARLACEEQAHHDAVLAEATMQRWRKYWQAYDGMLGDSALVFEQAEKEWAQPVPSSGGKHTLVGKRDGSVLHAQFKKRFLYEMKTAGDADRETYKTKLSLDKQISTNIHAMRAEGVSVDGVIYDIIWKPRLIRKVNRKTMPDETLAEFRERILADIDERPANYFERLIVYRSERDLEEAMADLGSQMAYLEAARSTLGYPRATGACEKFGKLCAFFSLCMDNQPESRANFHVRDRKLPELSKEVQ